jgi:UDPglucose 6-dehydrogenase
MLWRHVAAGRLRFTTSFAEAAKFAPVHFLGLATPGLPAGTFDLSQLRTAVTELAQHLTGPRTQDPGPRTLDIGQKITQGRGGA